MVITLSSRETAELKKIINSVDESGLEELKAELKGNRIITVKTSGLTRVEINVKEDYMADFLSVYSKYIGIAVNQVKALYLTVSAFSEEAKGVVAKYSSPVNGDADAKINLNTGDVSVKNENGSNEDEDPYL